MAPPGEWWRQHVTCDDDALLGPWRDEGRHLLAAAPAGTPLLLGVAPSRLLSPVAAQALPQLPPPPTSEQQRSAAAAGRPQLAPPSRRGQPQARPPPTTRAALSVGPRPPPSPLEEANAASSPHAPFLQGRRSRRLCQRHGGRRPVAVEAVPRLLRGTSIAGVPPARTLGDRGDRGGAGRDEASAFAGVGPPCRDTAQRANGGGDGTTAEFGLARRFARYFRELATHDAETTALLLASLLDAAAREIEVRGEEHGVQPAPLATFSVPAQQPVQGHAHTPALATTAGDGGGSPFSTPSDRADCGGGRSNSSCTATATGWHARMLRWKDRSAKTTRRPATHSGAGRTPQHLSSSVDSRERGKKWGKQFTRKVRKWRARLRALAAEEEGAAVRGPRAASNGGFVTKSTLVPSLEQKTALSASAWQPKWESSGQLLRLQQHGAECRAFRLGQAQLGLGRADERQATVPHVKGPGSLNHRRRRGRDSGKLSHNMLGRTGVPGMRMHTATPRITRVQKQTRHGRHNPASAETAGATSVAPHIAAADLRHRALLHSIQRHVKGKIHL